MKPMFKRLAILVLSLTLLIPSLASAHTVTVKSGSSDLRNVLERLLGEHAILAIVAMQKGIDGAPDFNDASGALMANADDLAAAIGSVYGADAGKAFDGLWKSHIGFFVDYVTATAKKDEAGRKAALEKLDNYRVDFSQFLASANPNFFHAQDLADGLQMHVNQLVSAFDSYANKDYTQAYASLREAYAHMFMTGAALADGISKQFPDKFTADGSSKAASDLRSAVDRLLGEHAMLAIIAMQKGISGAPDFTAAANALSANTDDLSAAIGSVYGKDAGAAFKNIWSDHIGFFVDYVTATSKMDETGRNTALDKLAQYGNDFGAFLESANPDNFKKADIAAALQPHVAQLISAFDNYKNQNYTTAYTSIREAYAHMFMTGDYLASGIVAQYQDKFHDAAPMEMSKIWLKIGSTDFNLNGYVTVMDTTPFIWDQKTYVPVRFLSEAIGATVTWDQATEAATVKAGNDTITFWIGKDYIEVNGMQKDIGMNVVLKDGRTQAPLRFIAELLGWNVAWNDTDWSITLTKAPAASTEMGQMMMH